ncbi:transposase [Pseudoroseomonas wenyumeiae]|uniref:Transposase n=1 Tax=Teichococcus wenyumeiae TaxID=2478470 RepID=A0A3A9JQR4_9PROT|nr:transposase [Pseudoroseomonas wenyumeiae]RMI17505.1 transposase [Pseudoroseomonas wenyumeiae]
MAGNHHVDGSWRQVLGLAVGELDQDLSTSLLRFDPAVMPWWPEVLPWPTCSGSRKAQIERISRSFPLSHGVPRVDDQRVVSGIIHAIRNGLRWRDAPAEYGPHKTLYRFIRWNRMGVFNRIFVGLAGRKGSRSG